MPLLGRSLHRCTTISETRKVWHVILAYRGNCVFTLDSCDTLEDEPNNVAVEGT